MFDMNTQAFKLNTVLSFVRLNHMFLCHVEWESILQRASHCNFIVSIVLFMSQLIYNKMYVNLKEFVYPHVFNLSCLF